MSISCFMISFANNYQNFEMPDSVNYYKYKGIPQNICRISSTHLDFKDAKVYVSDGTLNWT